MYPLINIFSLKIPSYGLCMLIGITLVILLTTKKAKKFGITVEDVLIVAATTIGFAIFFGYLLYILVTYPIKEIINMIKNLDFSFMRNGGIVFYGGLIGGIFGAFSGIKLSKISAKNLETCVVPYVPLGHAIGRIGCTLAGCCYGIKYNGLGAIFYHNSPFVAYSDSGHFPVQFLEAFLDICIMLYLLKLSKKDNKQYFLLFSYLLLYAIMRFFTEFLRGDAIRGIYFGISTSQWISIGLIIIASTFILKSKKS